MDTSPAKIKGGGAISKFGTKITLHVNDTDDLSRDVLKSDTAGISIPQLEFKLEEGGMEGVYTTVEGLLEQDSRSTRIGQSVCLRRCLKETSYGQ